MNNLNKIREAVAAMLEEEKKLSPLSPFCLSELWRESNLYLDYIRELSDEQLHRIRPHTSFITGIPWFPYFHHPLRNKPDTEKETVPIVQDYRDIVLDLPEHYWLSEPVNHPVVNHLGIEWKGRLINEDIVRFQRTILNLYNLGLFQILEAKERPVIFEIGGGYGGLAYGIKKILGKGCHIILDQAAMLFWSGVYLSVNLPEAKIAILTGNEASTADWDKLVAENDFVLIPHYALNDLARFNGIDMAVNLISFQEMTEQQLALYGSFLSRHINGILFSENFEHHPFNEPLNIDVSEVLGRYFDLFPHPSAYEDLKKKNHKWQLFVYLCKAKGKNVPLPIKNPKLHVPHLVMPIASWENDVDLK